MPAGQRSSQAQNETRHCLWVVGAHGRLWSIAMHAISRARSQTHFHSAYTFSTELHDKNGGRPRAPNKRTPASLFHTQHRSLSSRWKSLGRFARANNISLHHYLSSVVCRSPIVCTYFLVSMSEKFDRMRAHGRTCWYCQPASQIKPKGRVLPVEFVETVSALSIHTYNERKIWTPPPRLDSESS